MILTAHQPAYLPWLGYFHKVAISDVYVILDDVQFEKNSFTNRNQLKGSQGKNWITVPLLMKGHTSKTIRDMEINNNINWCKKSWNSIYLNYKKAPYFHRFCDFFEDLYSREWLKLIDILDYTLTFFFDEIGIKTQIIKQSDLNCAMKKQELIIELCKKLDANTFAFGKLGRDYAEKEAFKNNGINVYFQDYNHPEYNQLWGDFVPYLSIIDLLFNVETSRVFEIIMSGNITKKELKEIIEG